MARVRANCQPSERWRTARAIQDALGRGDCADIDLAVGLPSSRDSDNEAVYRLSDGRSLTTDQVASRLKSARTDADWNPNPAGNQGYDWLDAVRRAGVLDVGVLDAVLGLANVDSYRTAEVLASRSLTVGARGDLLEARELAEEAIAASHNNTWFQRWDGAQRRAAFQALRALDAQEGSQRSRKAFGEDLSQGGMGDYFLTSELPHIYRFLEIEWPQDAVLEVVEDFVDEILSASRKVEPYASLKGRGGTVDVDEAIVRFLVGMLGLPAVDVALAARRALSSYLARCRCRFVGALILDEKWTDIELEHLLIAVDVACGKNRDLLTAVLRSSVQSLQRHESLAVRHVAHRLCAHGGWQWVDVRDRPRTPRVHVPTLAGRVSRDDAGMFVGGDAAAAWELFEHWFLPLENAGVARGDLESEFGNLYARVEAAMCASAQHDP